MEVGDIGVHGMCVRLVAEADIKQDAVCVTIQFPNMEESPV